jgi:hypothetical protein
MRVEREEALRRLAGHHTRALAGLGIDALPFATAAQVHGNGVAVVDGSESGSAHGADALVTGKPGVVLGIYVADCCAIYLVDPVRRVIGLAHSGRKGTELGIATAAIEKMKAEFGSEPADMIAQLSPCIRPPDYEVDFAAEIARQCKAAGVGRVADCGSNTAADLNRYYSYRIEKGKTGRMLAVLALA